ncbi:MAG: hypothetical protein ACYCWA_02540 [Thiobacillus sp.]
MLGRTPQFSEGDRKRLVDFFGRESVEFVAADDERNGPLLPLALAVLDGLDLRGNGALLGQQTLKFLA